MTERVNCKNPDCSNSILTSTAEKNEGLCTPCVQANEMREYQDYISKNRKDVSLYHDVSDPVEIIKIMYSERSHDPLINYIDSPEKIEKVYRRLSEHEETRLLEYAFEVARSESIDSAESILLALAAFREPDLSKLHQIMLDQHEYCPGMLFKGAKPSVINELIKRLTKDTDLINNILSAIAWAGGPTVIEQFSDWISHSPKWSKDLYIPPEDYTKDAGWEVDKQRKGSCCK